jgi:hypothetical protein
VARISAWPADPFGPPPADGCALPAAIGPPWLPPASWRHQRRLSLARSRLRAGSAAPGVGAVQRLTPRSHRSFGDTASLVVTAPDLPLGRGSLCSARVSLVDVMFEAVGFVGGVLVTAGLVMILMAWGGMDERMPPRCRLGDSPATPLRPGPCCWWSPPWASWSRAAEGGWLRQQNGDCRSADGTSPPTSADLAPRRSALGIGWATAARSGQSVLVVSRTRRSRAVLVGGCEGPSDRHGGQRSVVSSSTCARTRSGLPTPTASRDDASEP